jgi:hypothetical protein
MFQIKLLETIHFTELYKRKFAIHNLTQLMRLKSSLMIDQIPLA